MHLLKGQWDILDEGHTETAKFPFRNLITGFVCDWLICITEILYNTKYLNRGIY